MVPGSPTVLQTNIIIIGDELSNIESWAQANNMILNRSKSAEIIFTNRRCRQQVDEPPPLTDITRVSSIKILGVTISNRLSLSQHVQNVVMSCAQTVHALRTSVRKACTV